MKMIEQSREAGDLSTSFAGMPDDPAVIHRWLLQEGRLDLLRERLSLSAIVGRTIKLEHAEDGEMRGVCPLPEHEDDQKAFFVNDRQGFFHCFGCGLHGDAIRWMVDHAGMDYVEAVNHLVREADLTPAFDAPPIIDRSTSEES